jgi:hypothetical protein
MKNLGIAVALIVFAGSMIGCQEQAAAPKEKAAPAKAHKAEKAATTQAQTQKAQAATKSAATKPAATTKPAAAKHAATKPAADKAAATKPAADKAATKPAAAADNDGWTLAYTADFSSGKLSADWAAFQGDAAIKDGAMVVSADNADGVTLLTKPVFSAPSVRIEVTASLAKAASISDLSVLLNANKTGPYEGYTLQFGGKANTMNGLTRKDDAVLSTVTTKPLVVAGKKYTIVAENDKGHIKMTVDGKTIIDYVDTEPISGVENGLIGFYTYESQLVIEKLSVFQKGDKK